jgi:hypothetical protein
MTDPSFTESPWFFGLFGAVLVVCVAVAYTKSLSALAKVRLPRLFAGRTHATAFETCRAALPGVDPARLRQAYRWVQDLVPYPDPPIQASDHLGRDLFVGRRGMLFRLSEAAMRLNPGKAHTQSPLYSVRTVADLMGEILRNGYEAQVHDPGAEPVAWQ